MGIDRHPIEEVFRGARKTLRILRVLILAGAPVTKYAIESQAAVYNAGTVLRRLEGLGVVKVLDGRPRRYLINRENPLVVAIEKFMKEVGYI